MAQFAPKKMALGSLTATRKLRNVEQTHARSLVWENGLIGANAVKHAPTVKAMVLLAPSQRPSRSFTQPSTVAHRASGMMVRSIQQIAMTSAARCLASEHGMNTLTAHPLVEMESSLAPFASHRRLSMVARNAITVTNRPTQQPATSVHALSPVRECTHHFLLVPQNVVEAPNRSFTWSSSPLRTRGLSARLNMERRRQYLAMNMTAFHRAWVGSACGAIAANLVEGARRAALSRSASLHRVQ